MNKTIIRLAKPTELKVVQDLNYELFLSDNRHLHDLEIGWPHGQEGTKYFRARIAGENDGVCFIADQDGEVIGYLAGAVQRPQAAYVGKRAEIENICVTEKIRAHGVGSQLIAAFYEWCRHQDVESVLVNAYTANQAALDFYAKNGLEAYSTTLWHQLK